MWQSGSDDKVNERVVELESDDPREEQLQRDTGSVVDVCVQFGSFSNTRTWRKLPEYHHGFWIRGTRDFFCRLETFG